MDNRLIITCVILAAALVLFLWNRIPNDLTAMLVMVALGVTGVLTPQEAFSGFSRSAVITIISVFVLTEALRRAGVTEQAGNILLRVGGKSELRLILAVMVGGALLSLFMSNIAAAAVLLPATSGAAKRAGVNTSKLLMPLAFSTILGGMATLFTTSNIILNSLLRDNNLEGFRITDFLSVGIPLMVVGILYIAFVGRWSLPGDSPIERTQAPDAAKRRDLLAAYGLGEKLFRVHLPENSSLIGKRLSESSLREDFDVSIVAIERRRRRLLDISPDMKLRRGDTLVLKGDEDDFRRRDVEPFMEFLPDDGWKEADLESQRVEVVEAMLAPRSKLIGKTLREAHFREKYGMTVLAVWHGDKEIITDLADVSLHFGDALLMQGPREKLVVLKDDPDLILLVSDEEKASITVPGKGRAALMIFAATLIFVDIYPDLIGPIMLGGALAMMLTGIISTDQAYASIGWKSVFLVAGTLPLGIALSKSNLAGLAAGWILSVFGGHGSLLLVAGIMFVTVVLTQVINGAAPVAIIGPLAIGIAQQAGIDPRSMVMAVAMAGAMAFVTPLAHSVNILVMGPGGYNFRDYVKLGLPLTAIVFVVSLIFLPLFWPF